MRQLFHLGRSNVCVFCFFTTLTKPLLWSSTSPLDRAKAYSSQGEEWQWEGLSWSLLWNSQTKVLLLLQPSFLWASLRSLQATHGLSKILHDFRPTRVWARYNLATKSLLLSGHSLALDFAFLPIGCLSPLAQQVRGTTHPWPLLGAVPGSINHFLILYRIFSSKLL